MLHLILFALQFQGKGVGLHYFVKFDIYISAMNISLRKLYQKHCQRITFSIPWRTMHITTSISSEQLQGGTIVAAIVLTMLKYFLGIFLQKKNKNLFTCCLVFCMVNYLLFYDFNLQFNYEYTDIFIQIIHVYLFFT